VLERFKQVADSAKELALWVVSPLVAVFIMALYLLKSNRDLKDEVAATDAAGQTAKQKEASDEAEKTAKSSIDEFRKLYSEYKGGDKPQA
jgi:mannitol-specific phosphotransferase system IIBC component